ncbi:hypothetical protein TRIUR3_33266 [Triticum urartu]|uniref:Uncharacterized protein n=1 Tax=Triticum urartu TaxID=4572 RepID=M7Z1K0_TRIUA|nr:hypothetical protein TRIUR3_33266 [Triticum urartu]
MDKWDELDDDDELRHGEAAMLPPHEMVARASAGGAGPAAPFSMLEGAGRTLKGRDLRRIGREDEKVRGKGNFVNAVEFISTILKAEMFI